MKNAVKISVCAALAVISWGCRKPEVDHILAAGVVDGDVLTIKSAVAGEVTTLLFTEGASVDQGDTLLTLNTEKLINTLEGLKIKEKEIPINRSRMTRKIKLLETSLSYWKNQVDRFQRLNQNDSISGNELEKARLQYEEVDAALHETRQGLATLNVQQEGLENQKHQIELNLLDFELKSPAAGTILESYISNGEYIFPGAPVADLLNIESLFIEIFLEGEEISRLKLEQLVSLQLDGAEGQSIPGRIIQFGQKAEFSPKYIVSEKERRSLLYRIKIRIEGDHGLFKLGMPLTVKID